VLAGIFRKCLDGTIDPWNIDLRGFVQVFSSLIDERYDDFPVAGYLLTEAWHILREKTEVSLEKRLVRDEEPEPEDYAYDEPTLEPASIVEPVRHAERRRVYLVELLDAMKLAFEKAGIDRISHHDRIEISTDDNFDEILNRMNSEDPENDIRDLWKHVEAYPQDIFTLEDLAESSGLNRNFVFLYCLFLAKEHRISLSQPAPYDHIIIRRTGR